MRSQLLVVSVLAAVAQLASFVKLWFVARIFGVGAALDGYNLALILPTMLSGVLAGMLQTAIFPIRAKIEIGGDPDRLASFERSVLVSVAAAGVVLAGTLVLAGNWLVELIAPRASDAVRLSLASALPPLALLIAFNLAGDCAGFLLAMRNRFSIAAGAPIANALIASGMLALWPEGGLTNLVWGTVIGLAAQVSICFWGLWRSGFQFTGALLAVREQRAYGYDMLRLAAAILPGVVLSNLLASLPPLWANGFGEGAVSAFGYAYRLHTSAVQLLVMASSTVLLARFSDLVARGDNSAVSGILEKAALASGAIGVTACIFVYAAGDHVLQLVFGGRFDVSAAEHVAHHWLWLTFGLPFALHGIVLAKLWQAQGRPHLSSLAAVASLAAAVAMFFAGRDWLAEYAVPAALAAAAATGVMVGWLLTPGSASSRPTALRADGSPGNSDAH